MHGYSGGLLRAVREAKGITLQEVADSTRISVRYLEAIEGDAHDRLPSATFVKGYVREVSRLLKLDEESVVTGYMRRLQ
jgi:cytoskeleton protein RodZ